MEESKYSRHSPEQMHSNVKELTAEQKAGMQLARSLLWIIAGVIVLYALIYLEHACNQPRAPALPGATALPHACSGSHQRAPGLEFAFSNFQYVLNVLLPLLTTVFGFIFGTKTRG